MTNVESLTLKASVWKILQILLLFAFAGASGFIISEVAENQMIMKHLYLLLVVAGWGLVAVSGLGLILISINLIPGASYLRLHPEGMEICALFCSQTISGKTSSLSVGLVLLLMSSDKSLD